MSKYACILLCITCSKIILIMKKIYLKRESKSMLECPHCSKANWKCNVCLNKRKIFKIALAFYRRYFKGRVKIPYILESNPHPNLIRTSFCRFHKRKKKSVRGSNPHFLWDDNGEDKDYSDWVTDNDSVTSDDGESDE